MHIECSICITRDQELLSCPLDEHSMLFLKDRIEECIFIICIFRSLVKRVFQIAMVSIALFIKCLTLIIFFILLSIERHQLRVVKDLAGSFNFPFSLFIFALFSLLIQQISQLNCIAVDRQDNHDRRQVHQQIHDDLD